MPSGKLVALKRLKPLQSELGRLRMLLLHMAGETVII